MPTALLVVQTAADFGGSYTWLQQMLDELPSLGWRFTVALSSDRSQAWESFFSRFAGRAEVTVLRSRTNTSLGRQRAIEDVVRSVGPDVVIPHLLFDVFPAMSRLKKAGCEVRLVYCAHEISSRMLADLSRYAGITDLAVGVSGILGTILREVVHLPRERVEVIPYGVPSSVVPHVPAAAGAPLRIGYAGRFEDDKRVLDLIPLCDNLDKLAVDYRLELAGRGSREAELRQALAPKVQSGRVVFHGLCTREQLYREIYPLWDVFVLCSPSEGWGIAIAEVMLNQIVPIVSDFRGRRQERLLRDGETALVFPVGDMLAAAAACKRVAGDPALMQALQTAAKNEIAGRFTVRIMAESWDRALRQALALEVTRGIVDNREMPAGRLDRVFGVRTGEAIRRLIAGRRNADDPWPYIGPEPAKSYAEIEALINAKAAESDDE